MVQQLHVKNNRALLYGYVAKETLSSLLLTTAKLNLPNDNNNSKDNQSTTENTNSNDLDNNNSATTPISFHIPPPFHAPKRYLAPTLINTRNIASSEEINDLLMEEETNSNQTNNSTSGNEKNNQTTIHLKQLIRETNFHLLQLARPESLFSCRKKLPLAYVKEYMLNQEHFNILAFLHHLINKSNDNRGRPLFNLSISIYLLSISIYINLSSPY